MHDLESADSKTCSLLAESHTHEGIWELPPIPPAADGAQQCERVAGLVVVCGVSVTLLGITHGVVIQHGDLSPLARSVCLLGMYSATIVALGCWGSLMIIDPGQIPRNSVTCYPQPAAVEERLRQGLGVGQMRNVVCKEGSGRTFCTRCLVWRPDNSSHHCRTCGRCVHEFDHHCGVLGVCIAGGNFKYFQGLVGAAITGCVVCFGFWGWSLAE